MLISCKKDDTLRYGNVTMGNLVDGKFISDQGNVFNFAEMLVSTDLEKFRRGIMQCDVLREVGENEYDVRVTYLDTVFTKAPVKASIAAEDPEKVVEDPIHIEQLWVSGGYVNMYIAFQVQIFPALKESKHMINLVLDDSSEKPGEYVFTLRHNAFGETVTQPDNKTEEEEGEVSTSSNPISWGLAGSYVSFPIADLIGEDNATVKFKWLSHVITGNFWSSATEQRSHSVSYSKDYFEHAPLNIKSRSVVRVR